MNAANATHTAEWTRHVLIYKNTQRIKSLYIYLLKTTTWQCPCVTAQTREWIRGRVLPIQSVRAVSFKPHDEVRWQHALMSATLGVSLCFSAQPSSLFALSVQNKEQSGFCAASLSMWGAKTAYPDRRPSAGKGYTESGEDWALRRAGKKSRASSLTAIRSRQNRTLPTLALSQVVIIKVAYYFETYFNYL